MTASFLVIGGMVRMVATAAAAIVIFLVGIGGEERESQQGGSQDAQEEFFPTSSGDDRLSEDVFHFHNGLHGVRVGCKTAILRLEKKTKRRHVSLPASRWTDTLLLSKKAQGPAGQSFASGLFLFRR